MIIFAAIYCVKVLGLKVAVLCSNETLLKNDFANALSFCKCFEEETKPTSSQKLKGKIDLSQGFPSRTAVGQDAILADITYCLMADLDEYYQAHATDPLHPFKNMVLILDEVSI